MSTEMARSTQPPSQYFAQFLVLDKTIGHYSAIHAEFNNGKTKLLVIDYFEGFDCNLSHFNESELAQSPDVELFIAGGEKLQNDSESCVFFAIAALDAAENMPRLFDHVTYRKQARYLAVRTNPKCMHRALAPSIESQNKKFFLAMTNGLIS